MLRLQGLDLFILSRIDVSSLYQIIVYLDLIKDWDPFASTHLSMDPLKCMLKVKPIKWRKSILALCCNLRLVVACIYYAYAFMANAKISKEIKSRATIAHLDEMYRLVDAHRR